MGDSTTPSVKTTQGHDAHQEVEPSSTKIVTPQASKDGPGNNNNDATEQKVLSKEVQLASPDRFQAQNEGTTEAVLDIAHKATTNPDTYLIVEDNIINAKILSAFMTKRNMTYQVASNGQEAVETYKSNPAACRTILMDTDMPVMGGFEATRAIREFEKEKGLEPCKIIIMTANVLGGVKEKVRDSGADACWQRPFTFPSLERILEELKER